MNTIKIIIITLVILGLCISCNDKKQDSSDVKQMQSDTNTSNANYNSTNEKLRNLGLAVAETSENIETAKDSVIENIEGAKTEIINEIKKIKTIKQTIINPVKTNKAIKKNINKSPEASAKITSNVRKFIDASEPHLDINVISGETDVKAGVMTDNIDKSAYKIPETKETKQIEPVDIKKIDKMLNYDKNVTVYCNKVDNLLKEYTQLKNILVEHSRAIDSQDNTAGYLQIKVRSLEKNIDTLNEVISDLKKTNDKLANENKSNTAIQSNQSELLEKYNREIKDKIDKIENSLQATDDDVKLLFDDLGYKYELEPEPKANNDIED